MLSNISKIFFILFFYWVALVSAQSSITNYPNWFLYPAQFNSITVGFSSPDSTTKQNAAKMKAVFDSCIVYGNLFLYETIEDDDLNRYSDYYYYYSHPTATKYTTQFVPLDKRIVNILNNEYVEAFSLDSSNNFDFAYIDIDTLKKPDWLNKSFYEQEEYYYSVGMYTSMGKDNDAWITSEERALFNLLRNIYSNIYGAKTMAYSEKESDDEYENITAYKLNARIKNIEIIERYPNKSEQLYFTLIRVKKGNIFRVE